MEKRYTVGGTPQKWPATASDNQRPPKENLYRVPSSSLLEYLPRSRRRTTRPHLPPGPTHYARPCCSADAGRRSSSTQETGQQVTLAASKPNRRRRGSGRSANHVAARAFLRARQPRRPVVTFPAAALPPFQKVHAMPDMRPAILPRATGPNHQRDSPTITALVPVPPSSGDPCLGGARDRKHPARLKIINRGRCGQLVGPSWWRRSTWVARTSC